MSFLARTKGARFARRLVPGASFSVYNTVAKPLFSKVLGEIEEAGTYKKERVILSKQNPHSINVKGTEKSCINFCANNYLGLADNERLINAAINQMKSHGLGLASVRWEISLASIYRPSAGNAGEQATFPSGPNSFSTSTQIFPNFPPLVIKCSIFFGTLHLNCTNFFFRTNKKNWRKFFLFLLRSRSFLLPFYSTFVFCCMRFLPLRFICGTQDIHKQLEAAISNFHGTEDTILYSSCFDANGGLFEGLLTAEDAIITDRSGK